MSKVKSKGAKDTKSSTTLNKAKDAGVAKPAVNGKKQEVDRKAVKEEKKRKVKEPTPSSSEEENDSSEESGSESESDSEVEAKAPVNTKAKSNGVKAAAKAESSDESEDSDESDSEDSGSDDEAIEAGVLGKAPAVTEQSDSDEGEGDSDESETEAKKPAPKVQPKADADSTDDSEEDSDDSEESEAEAPAKPAKRKAEEEAKPAAKKSKTEEVDTSKGPNLFIGNLSWNVDEDWLRSEFESFGEISGVRLMTDRQTGRSKGFGYVEFVSAADAAKAQAAKHDADLDGRQMNVDFANAKPAPTDRTDNRRKSYGDQLGEPSDTLFCGNLSFDCGQEAVTEAFSPHGTIMSVRLPTDRETGEPKGFGYVTFSSVEEATAALGAMQGGYINGRPVRLDYSQPRPQQDSNRGGFGGRGRGGFSGGRGGGRGGRGDSRGGRGGFGGRGGRGGSRPQTTNRGGFGDFSGKKMTF